MQQKQLTVLCQAVVSCTLGILGLQMLHSVAPAQTGKEAEADKTLKTTRKTKKPAVDSAPSEATAPAKAGEKMSKPKKSRTSDVTSSPTSTPAAGEKAMKPKKANRAMPEAATPPAAAPAEVTPKPVRSKRMKTSEPGMPSSGSASRAQTGESTPMVPAPARNASGREISSAKATGKVWVNTDSGIYHKGGQWYGATKQGKFMTEQEAVRAGYKPAKNEK
jgi:cytoskeletal protein RodZ